MIIDALLVLSDAQGAITATAASTSYVDTLAAGDAYDSLWVEFLINTTFTANSATVQFELQCDDNSSFSSPRTLLITGALADTLLVAGYRPLVARVPKGCERYIRANYTVTGTGVAGKVDARLIRDVDFTFTGV